MKGLVRPTKPNPKMIKIKMTSRSMPAGAEVKITDTMLQPGGSVSGWLPHVTELPWASGLTYLNTTPTGETVFWDEIEGKPVVFPALAHQHDASDINSGVLALDRIPVLDQSKLGPKSVTSDQLSDAIMDLLDQHTSAIAALEAQVNGP